jgi:hypothetical protein
MAGDIPSDPFPLKVILAVLPGLLGFVGSWIGAQIAMSSFKRQRAFDKQLDWYERAAHSLRDLAQKIEIAVTFQEEQGTSPEHLGRVWRDVQNAHLELDRLAHEAGFYGSTAAMSLITGISEAVQEVADQTAAFDVGELRGKKKQDALALITGLPERLIETHGPLVAEGRRQLRLDPSGWIMRWREWASSSR